MAKLANLTFPITKRTDQSDGTLVIEGPVTDESLDLDGQIVDAASAAKALQEWFDDHANVRQQHSPVLAPAGKGMALKFVDGTPFLTAHIVEPTAVKLTKARVYDSFSIGIADGRLDTSPAARKRAPEGILYPSLVNEVSIVDYPANVSMGKFSIAKRRKDGVIVDTQKIKVYDKSLRGLEGDSLVEALKSAHSAFAGAIVHTAASPDEALALIGTQFPSNDYEVQGNVIVMKRQMDPDVGGGVDRDKIPKKDFAGKNRTFPIVTPGDVSDAASSIGRAGDDNYDAKTLKANIIAIAQRKGPEFVSELPKKWRNEMGKSQKSKKADKAPGSKKKPPFEGAAPPFTSKDDDAKSMKGSDSDSTDDKKIPDVDQAVTEDLEKADDAVSQAKDDQAKDNAAHLAGKDDDDKDEKSKKKAAKKAAKKAKKDQAAADMKHMEAMKRAHDVLCPLYKGNVTKSLAAVTEAVDPEVFRERFMGTPEDNVETRAARKSAYGAAAQVATLQVKELSDLRRAAHKAFKDSYPDLKVASPDLSDPSSFQRGFLPSATKETSTSTSKPGNFPTPKPLSADQFTRGPLTVNESRPSLMGGTSVAMKGRQFYTNAAKDANADAMATLHDHIMENYPSVCPAGMLTDETGDRLGTAPEMYSPAPAVAKVPDMADSGLVAAKRAATEAVGKAVKPLVKKNRKQAKAIKSLKRKLRKELARPDYTKSAHRGAQFAAIKGGEVTEITEGKKKRLERAKMLSSRIHDRNSVESRDAIEELQGLVSPEEYAAIMTADE